MHHSKHKICGEIGLIVLFTTFACFLPSLAAADRMTEERAVRAFHSVDLKTVGNIELSQGDRYSLVVRAEARVLSKLKTEVRGGVLVISSRQPIGKADAPEIIIEMDDIRLLKISGSGTVEGVEKILSTDLNLVIAGSGAMNMEVKAEQLESKVSGSGDMFLELEALTATAHISGSGDVEMEGKAADLDVRISGSGSLEAFDLETMNATIKISGSGSCRVKVRERLDVDISGSGNVVYEGNPKVNLSGSGSGSVRSK